MKKRDDSRQNLDSITGLAPHMRDALLNEIQKNKIILAQREVSPASKDLLRYGAVTKDFNCHSKSAGHPFFGGSIPVDFRLAKNYTPDITDQDKYRVAHDSNVVTSTSTTYTKSNMLLSKKKLEELLRHLTAEESFAFDFDANIYEIALQWQGDLKIQARQQPNGQYLITNKRGHPYQFLSRPVPQNLSIDVVDQLFEHDFSEDIAIPENVVTMPQKNILNPIAQNLKGVDGSGSGDNFHDVMQAAPQERKEVFVSLPVALFPWQVQAYLQKKGVVQEVPVPKPGLLVNQAKPETDNLIYGDLIFEPQSDGMYRVKNAQTKAYVQAPHEMKERLVTADADGLFYATHTPVHRKKSIEEKAQAKAALMTVSSEENAMQRVKQEWCEKVCRHMRQQNAAQVLIVPPSTWKIAYNNCTIDMLRSMDSSQRIWTDRFLPTAFIKFQQDLRSIESFNSATPAVASEEQNDVYDRLTRFIRKVNDLARASGYDAFFPDPDVPEKHGNVSEEDLSLGRIINGAIYACSIEFYEKLMREETQGPASLIKALPRSLQKRARALIEQSAEQSSQMTKGRLLEDDQIRAALIDANILLDGRCLSGHSIGMGLWHHGNEVQRHQGELKPGQHYKHILVFDDQNGIQYFKDFTDKTIDEVCQGYTIHTHSLPLQRQLGLITDAELNAVNSAMTTLQTEFRRKSSLQIPPPSSRQKNPPENKTAE
jgi:hypothetical protein